MENELIKIYNQKKKKNLSEKHTRYGHVKESEKKVPTYLTRKGRASQFTIQPIPTHFHGLPCKVPIGVTKARYQSNHNVSGLKVVPILQAPHNGI